MKRYIIILIAALTAFQLTASAQDPWFLFPGSHKKTGVDTTAVKAQAPDTTLVQAVDSTVRVSRLKTALILPLGTNGTPSSNFLDFYCGVLLAADGYSASGVPSELVVYDSSLGLPRISELKDFTFLLGPVGVAEMDVMADRCPQNAFLVSPLDPKGVDMTYTRRVIQAPASWEAQVDELAAWVRDETASKDLVVLLQNPEEPENQMTRRMAEMLSAAGIAFSISESASTVARPAAGRTRFVLLSENDSYIGSQVREIALMNITDREVNAQSDRIALYGTSRMRNSSDLDPETLFSTATRIVSNYYADSSSAEVKAFSAAYRARFKAEPSSFAYQGYDIMKYFSGLFATYGEAWSENIETTPYSGLHTDFRFASGNRSGKVNNAVRRVRYNYNNTTTLVR